MSDEVKGPDRAHTLSVWLSWILFAGAIVYAASKWATVIGMIAVAVGALIAAVLSIGFAIAREVRRFNSVNERTNELLTRGEYERAAEIFRAWSASKVDIVTAVARHNHGWTLLRQGKLQQAITVLTDNDHRSERALKTTVLFATSTVDIAFAHALRGNVAEAEQWLDKSEERAKIGRNASYPAMAAFARAVIDCRAGRAAEAARMLEDRWTEIEASLTGSISRPLRVVRAFAHAAGGPRGAGLAEQALASMRPAYPGELDFLGIEWPEMQIFLAAHNLAS